MTNKDAAEILRDHNEWRRGERDDWTGDVKAIGQAIDQAVKALVLAEKLVKLHTKWTIEGEPKQVLGPKIGNAVESWQKQKRGKRGIKATNIIEAKSADHCKADRIRTVQKLCVDLRRKRNVEKGTGKNANANE